MPVRHRFYDPFIQQPEEPAAVEMPLMVLERAGFYMHVEDAITMVEQLADRHGASGDAQGSSVLRGLAAHWQSALEKVREQTGVTV